ncbi:MAG: hypothetical protein HQ543_00470 [Bacteroidetes bacterium]|nr:hypothetical protein [Bacteroidota bacterium]
MNERLFITEDKLVSILNKELGKYDQCNDCRFMSVGPLLKEYDETGCNWSQANLNCSGVPLDICRPFANKIVAEAKSKYNIKK